MEEHITIDYAGRPLTISTGGVAKQADGSVLVQYGDTVVLVTAVTDKRPSDRDFLPLTVNYQEMSYAAGRIPGGFLRRESRNSDKTTLTARLIDRGLRPLFPKSFRNETQVIVNVLSVDQENDPVILGIIGASCALTISQIPFGGPMAGVKIGRKEGAFIINPSAAELEESDIDIIVAGTKEAILMVEGAADFAPSNDLIEAIHFGHQSLLPLIECQEKLKELCGKEKMAVQEIEIPDGLKDQIRGKIEQDLIEAFAIRNKLERYSKQDEIRDNLVKEYEGTEASIIIMIFEDIIRDILRQQLLTTRKRIDGRSPDEVRNITCKAGVLPRAHGSALFTRGETQALAITTLGTSDDEQKIESLQEGEIYKNFMLHYNFPPFSVGEVGMLRGPSRREIGHGNLALRALTPTLPERDGFPYTIRIVSEILESNGSSSMATVCGGCLSLMDAGVPIKEPVAGIAMGLVKEGETEIVLTDILGDEDHLGDMDFKVAGSKRGVNAIQMDIKIKGITKEIMSKAVTQAQEGIEKILGIMAETLPGPRESISQYAPRMFTIKIKTDKIRDVIGPGGKMIRSIVEQTGVKIDIDDSGTVTIASPDEESAAKAIEIIQKLTKEVEVGETYFGKVVKVLDAGVIVELAPGVDGFVHISQLADGYIKKTSDVTREGDEFMVKVIAVEPNGRIKLSRKALLNEEKGWPKDA
ncbi:MAG: polyribonucleotide nucleotidyltransferase [Proteobacteria bacterium]|nr:polyribonucleotide nucleotidyltransferase [Pseudomonadota bacterium]